MPMQRIPFPLEFYESQSLPLSAKRLVNLMVEAAPEDARTPAYLTSTPTLQFLTTIGTGPILAMNDDEPGVVYIVSGTHFYRVRFDPTTDVATVEDLGSVGTADAGTSPWNSFPTIAVGPTACVVCVAPNAFTCAHLPGDPLNQITDTDFPGATSVCYVDGYFAFSSLGDTAQWFISKILDPTMFDALDFAFSDALPNVIRRVIAHRSQIWTVGESGFEIWYDAGSADFPFRRASGGVIPVGTGSPESVARADRSIFWIGLDSIIYRSRGYEPLRISTHAVEEAIDGACVGLTALTHSYNGHWFYYFTAIGGRTFGYDIATGKWHERSTSTDGDGPWQCTRSVATASSLKLFGDRVNGNLYTLANSATDAGVTVIRLATLPTLWGGTNRAFCSRVEIEMEVGGAQSPTSLLLNWSDDGARTWKAPRSVQTGAVGETRKRVFTTRLGSFRERTFRITCTGVPRFYAMDADIQPGAS